MSGLNSPQNVAFHTNAVEASLFQAPPSGAHSFAVARVSKRAFDLLAALTALTALSVLFAMIVVAIFVMEGRPIFFRHRRIGKDGSTFDCLKFRTMTRSADAALNRHLESDPAAMLEWQATHKLRQDPRITSIGKILRNTSIDELPQLINIVRGDMSLVGPRPIVAEEVERYGAAITEYYSVRPGLTGPWQCGGRNDVSYERRVTMDLQYVRTWSFVQDIAIIIRTVPAVLTSRGVY